MHLSLFLLGKKESQVEESE